MRRFDAVGCGTTAVTVALVAAGFLAGALAARSPSELAVVLLAVTMLAGLVMLAGFWLAGRMHDGD